MKRSKNHFNKIYYIKFLVLSFVFCYSLSFQYISAEEEGGEEISLGYRQWSGKKSDIFSIGEKNRQYLGTRPTTPGIEQIDSLFTLDKLENYVAREKKIKIFNQEIELKEERSIIGVEVKKQWQGVFTAPIQYKNLLIKNAKLTLDAENKVLEISGDVSFFDLFNINIKLTFMPINSPIPPRVANPNTIDKIKYALQDKTKELKEKAIAQKNKTLKFLPTFSQEQKKEEKDQTELDLRVIIEGKLPVGNVKPFEKTNIPGLKDITILDSIVLFDFTTALSFGIQVGCVCDVLNTTVIGSIGIQRLASGRFTPVMKVELPDEWSIGVSVPALKNTPLNLLKFKDTQFVVSTENYIDQDMDGLPVSKGINIASTLLVSGPLDKLNSLLGKTFQELKVYGAISPDPEGMKIGTLLPFSIPFKNPRVRGGSVAFELTGKPSLGLKFILFVAPTNVDKLALIAKIQMDPVSAILSGTMQGEWNDPFGIVGLSVADIAVQTALSYTSPIAISGFGFTGKVKVGSKFMGVGMNVTTNPEDFVVYGELMGSLSIADLLQFAQDIAKRALEVGKDPKKLGESSAGSLAISVTPLGPVVLGSLFAGIVVGNILGKVPPSVLPNISINDPKLLVAPTGGSIGEITFEKGITLRGMVSIINQVFAVDFNVSFAGFWAKSAMSEILIGTNQFPLMKISGPGINISGEKTIKKGPILDIEVTSKDQHFLIDGSIEILGIKQDTKLMISSKGLSFSFTKNVSGFLEAQVSGEAPLNLKDPDFMVSILIRTNKLYQMVKDAIRSALSKIPGISELGSSVIDPVLNAFDLRKLEGTLRLKDLEKIKLPRLNVDATLFGQSINFSIQADLSDPNKIKDFIVDGVLGKIKDAIWDLIKNPLMAAKLLGDIAAKKLISSAQEVGRGLQKSADEIRDVASKGAQQLKDAGEKGVKSIQTAGIFIGDNVVNTGKVVSQNVEDASRVALGGIANTANALKSAFVDLGNAIKDLAESALSAIGIDTGAKERKKREAEERIKKQIEQLIGQANNYITSVINPLEKLALDEQAAAITIKKQVQEYYEYAAAAVANDQSLGMLAGYIKELDSIKNSVGTMRQQVILGTNQVNTMINPAIDSIVRAIPPDVPNEVAPSVSGLNSVILQMRNTASKIVSIFNQNIIILNEIMNDPVGGGNLNKFKPELLNLSIIDSFRLAAELSKFYLNKMNNLSNQATTLMSEIKNNKTAIEHEKTTGEITSGLQIMYAIISKANKISDLQNQIQKNIDKLNIINDEAMFYQTLSAKLKDISFSLLDATHEQASGEIKTIIDLISKNKDLCTSYFNNVKYIMSQPPLREPLMNEQQVINAATYAISNTKKLADQKAYNEAVQKQSQKNLQEEQARIEGTPDWIRAGGLAWVQEATEEFRNAAEEFDKLDMVDVMKTLNEKMNGEFDKTMSDLSRSLMGPAPHLAARDDYSRSLLLFKITTPSKVQDFARGLRVTLPDSEANNAANMVQQQVNKLADEYHKLILNEIIGLNMNTVKSTLGADFDNSIKNLASDIGSMEGRNTAPLGNESVVRSLIMEKAISSSGVKEIYGRSNIAVSDRYAKMIARKVDAVLKTMNQTYQQKQPQQPQFARVVWTPPIQNPNAPQNPIQAPTPAPAPKIISSGDAIKQMDVAKLFAANQAAKESVINDLANNLKQQISGIDIIGINATPATFKNKVEQLLVQKAQDANTINNIFQATFPESMTNTIKDEVTKSLGRIINKFKEQLKAQNIYV